MLRHVDCVSHGAPAYAPPSGDTWRDPFPMYAALRDHDPVHHVEAGDYWVLTRHATCSRRARPRDVLVGPRPTTQYDELERIGLVDNPPMVMTDPPSHTEFRRLVSARLHPTAGRVDRARRARVRRRAARPAACRRRRRHRRELFKPLPSMVVAHYLGVPEEDRGRFDGWTDAIVAANASAAYAEVGGRGRRADGLLRRADRVAPPRAEDDTVSHLVAAGEAGDDAGLLRILAFTFTMVTGGNDTTTGLLGGGVQLLSERPDQRALAARRPWTPTRRGAAPADHARCRAWPDDHARRRDRRVTIPAGRKVLMALRRGQPRPATCTAPTPRNSTSPATRGTS